MTGNPTIVERRVVIGGIATRTLEVPGDGPPLLLLHGFTDSADTWRPVLEQLGAANRRAVAVDLPGQGFAPPVQPPILTTLDRFVADFVTMHALDGPVVVAGNSLGGLLALRAARHDHLPVAAVAALGPGGLRHTRRLKLVAQWARIHHPFLLFLDRLPVPRSVIGLGALAVHRRLAEGEYPDLAARYASHFRSVRDVSRLRGDLVSLSHAEKSDTLRPADIRRPVLLVWGERDLLADISGAALVLDAVSESRLVVLDCGHLPQVQLPAEVATLLMDLPALHPDRTHETSHEHQH